MKITQAELAKRAGVTRQYIHKLCKDGKLLKEKDGKVDLDSGLLIVNQIRENQNIGMKEWNERQKKAGGPERAAQGGDTQDGEVSAKEVNDFLSNKDGSRISVYQAINRTKLQQAMIRSKMAQLELDEKQGRLISITDVQDSFKDISGKVRAELIKVVNVLPPKIVGVDNLGKVKSLLSTEINNVLKRFQKLGERYEKK